jgi:hypothetical protein
MLTVARLTVIAALAFMATGAAHAQTTQVGPWQTALVFMALRPAQAQSFSPYAGRGCYASTFAKCATQAELRAYGRRAYEQIARERAQIIRERARRGY